MCTLIQEINNNAYKYYFFLIYVKKKRPRYVVSYILINEAKHLFVVVDDTRFVVNTAQFISRPDTMLGRLVTYYFSHLL